jgi:hypothetical protein
MSGGIVQLVATGVQDVHLSGSPEVSFFRSNYKRHTHFASSVERQLIQGQPTPAGISTIRVERKGDLLSYTYLTARDSTGLTRSDLDWSQIIDRVELLIGGQVVDLQDPFFTYNIDPVCMASSFSQRYIPQSVTLENNDNAFFPFKFFFCKEWQTALPLIALQYHDVEIRITWGSKLSTQEPQGAPTGANYDQDNEDGSGKYFISAGVSPSNTATLTASNVIGTVSLGSIVGGSGFRGLVYVTDPAGLSETAGISAGTFDVGLSTTQTWPAILSTAQENIQFYSPPTGGSMTVTAQGAGAVTTCTATLNTVFGNRVEPGAIVTNSGISGLVYITAVTYANDNETATSVTLAFPSQVVNTLIDSKAIGIFPPNVAYEPTLPSALQFESWGNFVYLDATERDYFAKSKFDMLITQVQRIPIINDYRQELVFNHPIKFIASNVSSYTNVNQQLKIQINGTDIGEYRALPHWVEIPQYYHTPFGYHAAGIDIRSNVMIIPFCLDTAKYQPTGTLNFSRIDNFRIMTPLASGYPLNSVLGSGNGGNSPQGYIYAVNYNILTIQNGQAGLRYGS